MKKLSILALTFFLLTAFGQAQLNVKGVVKRKDGQPAQFATILLRSMPDSILVKTSLTDSAGSFVIEKILYGNYTVNISLIGHTPYIYRLSFSDSTQTEIVLPTFFLEKTTQQLTSVTVTANRPFIEQGIDRTTVNVDALISNVGTSALEALAKSPGVVVDENGNISLKGKSGVLVLIDDRPTYLSSADLANYLRSLPSSSVDKIELMTNPPAKYDAASGGGVIIIRTKKIKTRGFNGSIAAGSGVAVYGRGNGSINLNYRDGKFNFFGNIAVGSQKSWRKLEIVRKYLTATGQPESVFSQTSYFKPERDNHNFKTGIDYFLSAKTTIGVVLNHTASESIDQRPVQSFIYNSTGLLDSLIDADNRASDKFSSPGLNLNFSHRFDSSGRMLTFDLDRIKYVSESGRSFINSNFNVNNQAKRNDSLTADLPSDILIQAFKADYFKPYLNGSKMEAGFKSSYVAAENTADYFIISGGSTIIDNDKTNRFTYKENIYAAYMSFTSRQYKTISIKAGLRIEHTDVKGHQFGNPTKPDSAFTNRYTSLFPTGFISYRLDSSGKNLLNLNYGRRITRPFYQDLNPFVFLLDKFTYFSGNPFLRAQFSNNFELAYHYKSILTASLLYNYASDLHLETIEQAGNIFISRTGNIGRRIFMGVSMNANLKPVKGWTTNIYTEVINNEYKDLLSMKAINTQATYWYISVNNQLVFSKGWSGEISGYHITKSTSGQFNRSALWQLNTGLQKKVLKDKASLKLSLRDIFNSNQPRGNITNIPATEASYHNYFDTRAITIGFSLNFGKVLKTSKRNTGSSEEEQGRIKN